MIADESLNIIALYELLAGDLRAVVVKTMSVSEAWQDWGIESTNNQAFTRPRMSRLCLSELKNAL